MYSVKPGRGPSLMGVVGGIIAVFFGIGWTIFAVSMGAPVIFAFFGVLFVIMALGGVAYNLYNATQKNRMSTLDITSGQEESDPIANWMGHERTAAPSTSSPNETSADLSTNPRRFEGDYCPFCGSKVEESFDFCPNCGKDI